MTVREYVVKILQEPLKKYRTPVQDAILEIMIEYLEEYHTNIQNLPSIMEPNKERYDILTVIAHSYGFTIRPEALIDEQVNILANIAYVYKLRGSVYSIEHMKELYGGDLPSPVHISIPSYSIFRYDISPYDQNDVYQDGDHFRPGIYDINIYRYYNDINVLVDWLYKELVTSGAIIEIINHLNMGDMNAFSDDNTVTVSDHLEDLYNSNLYMTVIDEEGHIVALQSVDEFRYIRDIPSDYTARILKYTSEGSLVYYIDIEDDSVHIEYGFSSNKSIEPPLYTTVVSSTLIDPTDTYLWIKLIKGGSVKTAVVDLKDEGENWYVQYALVNELDYDWIEWTDATAYTPGSFVFTADPTSAIGLYIRSELSDEYPLCTYKTIKLYKNPEVNGKLLKSSYYSEIGIDEYGNIGTEVASITFTYSITRSEYMTDSLVMILKETEN